ncbi:rod shape-determining protein RodA, partial [Comamonas sp.]
MSAIEFDKPSLLQRIVPLFRGFDFLLLLFIAMLAGAGLLAMYSAGFDHGTRFVDHGRNMLIAAGLLFLLAQIPPQQLMKVAVPLYAVGVALLVAVVLFGITKKGATRWVNVGVVIQPSEILKIATPLMLAWWFQRREGNLRASDFAIAFVLLMVPVGLIMKQPDLGTSLLVMAAGLSVIFFAGLPWKLIVPPVVLAVVGIFLIVWFEPQLCADGVSWYLLHDYQRTRVCTLLDPTRDPLGKGFHIIQGMIAIGSGGIWGKGFMAGTQTHLEFIPERTTDFIFAAYSEEFGLVGNLFIIVGFLLLVWRGLAIAMHANSLFGRLMASAVAMIFFTYAFVNMGMVSG